MERAEGEEVLAVPTHGRCLMDDEKDEELRALAKRYKAVEFRFDTLKVLIPLIHNEEVLQEKIQRLEHIIIYGIEEDDETIH